MWVIIICNFLCGSSFWVKVSRVSLSDTGILMTFSFKEYFEYQILTTQLCYQMGNCRFNENLTQIVWFTNLNSGQQRVRHHWYGFPRDNFMGESNSHSTVNCHQLLPLPASVDDIFKLWNFNHILSRSPLSHRSHRGADLLISACSEHCRAVVDNDIENDLVTN